MAEEVPTNNQRGQRSGPCRLWGGLDKARNIVPTALLVRVQCFRKGSYKAVEGPNTRPIVLSMITGSYCRRRRRLIIFEPDEKKIGYAPEFFFNRGQKWWRKLNGIVTSSTLLQNGTYIWILVSIKRQFQVVCIDMKHDWKKATLIPAVAAKNRDASNLTRHFHWGLPSSQGGTTPKLKNFGNNFYMNWQRTYFY